MHTEPENTPSNPSGNNPGDAGLRLPHHAWDEVSFADLVTRYLDGGLDAPGVAQLNALLLALPNARMLFVRIVRLHGMLTERALATDQSNSHSFDHSAGESLDDAIIHPAIHEAEVQDSADLSMHASPWNLYREQTPQPVPQNVAEQVSQTPKSYNWMSHPAVRSGLAAVVLIGLWVGFRALQRSSPASKTQVVITPPVLTTAQSQNQPEGDILLGDALNARFESLIGSLPPGTKMPEGDLTLSAGWIRIDFPSGVSAVVEAPARFSVQSNSRMALTSGRISALVPPAGHGFSIAAPYCEVVDLGTEFGISVDSSGENTVQIFQGKVSLTRPAGAGDSAGTLILANGDARKIVAMDEPTEVTAAAPESFLRRAQFDRWSTTLRQGNKATVADRWRTYSEQLSRDPSLQLYFTFNDRQTSPAELKNHARSTLGQFDIPLFASTPDWVDGRLPGLSAMNFNPSQKERLLLPAYPLTPNGQLSCAAWVYARTRPAWASIAKSWGNNRCGAFHFGLLSDTGDLDIQLDGSTAGGPRVSEGANHPFPLNRWVHVAFTSDGKNLCLYRDGKQVASVRSRPIAVDEPIKSLSIGVKTDDDGVTPSIPPQCGFWDGMIGEFALFHRALTADEISHMSEFGPL